MADELGQVRVLVKEIEQTPPKMAVEWSAEALDHSAPIPEQTRSMDAVFAQEQGEPNPVAGYLALWAGMLLAKDIMKGPESADDERQKKLNAKQRDCECC